MLQLLDIKVMIVIFFYFFEKEAVRLNLHTAQHDLEDTGGL